jgi:hypothetical protein
MEFVSLTLDGIEGPAGLVVQRNHIAYYQADVRQGREGTFSCGILVMKSGEKLHVHEDLDEFKAKIGRTAIAD